MNQSELNSWKFPVTCAKRGKNCAYTGEIGSGFASHWLKTDWPEIFKPITKRSNRNHDRIIIFDNHLKTALICLSDLNVGCIHN